MEAKRLEDLYELMLTSRRFDEECTRLLGEGVHIPHYHSGVGQEALMVGSAAPLRTADTYIYTHRGYGQLLAKGVSLREIALDMWLKDGGTNHGRGSVMHVNRPDLGLPGREGVFGTRFGLAVGFALAHRLNAADNVVVCCYGEAAGARGPLYEAMNMAVLWQLPVLFLAENNGWSFTTPTQWMFPQGKMSNVWRGFDIPVEVIDGNDVESVYGHVADAIESMRAAPGPRVIEGMTYRLDPHIWWDDASYQSKTEIEAWRTRDPITFTESRLEQLGVPRARVEDTQRAVAAEVAATVQDALSTPDLTGHGC
ncbi:MAG: thiamine pyrophosphate-dependent dehydrogenase E1 component subunit alpha [Acidimicrobiia bacterium]